MDKVLNLLNRLALTDLENLAGQTIIKAVKSAYETNNARELSRLIIDRYGYNLLSQSLLRVALIDRMTPIEAKNACDQLGIKISDLKDPIEPYQLLEARFDNNFTEKKSIEFVQIFNFPEQFITKKIIETRQSGMLISSVYGDNLVSKGTLHPYQLSLKDSIGKLIYGGIDRLIAQMPTGAGKTMTALELVSDFVRSHKFNGFIVWIVDSNELADQALMAFNSLWLLRGDRPTNSYRYFGDFNNNFEVCSPGVVFTSFSKCNAAINSKNENDNKNFIHLCRKSSLVIVDEAHTSVAPTYSATINQLISYGSTLLGLTATPSGNNDIYRAAELRSLYGSNLVEMKDENGEVIKDPIKYLQQHEYLAEINYEQLDSNAELGDINEGEACIRLAEHSERNNIIIQQIERAVSRDESTIVFACTVDHVIALVALCRAKNLDVDFIIGEVPQSRRIEIFDRFKKKELKIIINHEMLSTGVDLPNLNKLIITRPVGSAILYSQIVGRALRGPKNGGNKINTIVNIKDNDKNYPQINLLYQTFRNQFN